MSSSEYTPLSGRTRLIAAAIFVAVAVGMTGGDATGLRAAVVPAASALPHTA